jgi:hypothetical protein
MCSATSRGIKKVPTSVHFATASRPTAQPVGSAATVPIHYAPPPLLNRDFTTVAKNAPKVPFAMSTRESRNKVNVAQPSMPNAGPGAYDVVRGMRALSTAHKTTSDGSFFTAHRDAGNWKTTMATRAGPGAYPHLEKSLDYVGNHLPKVPIPTAKRWAKEANADYPAPRAYKFVERHTPRMAFPTGPGHVMEPANPATAAVEIRDVQRPVKHKPAMSFGSAIRWGNPASTG